MQTSGDSSPSRMPVSLAFPPGFVWGAGTSPTQVEGEIDNEWEGYAAADGCTVEDGGHQWRRYRYDFTCLSRMHLNAYRLGFDWARLQPDPDQPLDRHVLLYYLEMLAELRSLGVEPYLTLFHFACPQWLARKGGWAHPDAPRDFAVFAQTLVEATDGEVRHWITFHEPVAYAWMAYMVGTFPPFKKRAWSLYRTALRNMADAHRLVYERIRAHQADARVGVALHSRCFSPSRPHHPLDHVGTFLTRRLFGRYRHSPFLRQQGREIADFLMVNDHGRAAVEGYDFALSYAYPASADLDARPEEAEEEFVIEMESFEERLVDAASQVEVPLYLTTTGVAAADRIARTRYMHYRLKHAHGAIARGVPLRGLFYWPLIDSFGWADGFRQPTGLLGIDMEDPRRRRQMRPLGRWFGEVAEHNALALE